MFIINTSLAKFPMLLSFTASTCAKNILTNGISDKVDLFAKYGVPNVTAENSM